MNNKLKYSLIIALTLLIGFIIGFLVNGRLTHRRMEKLNKVYADQGFGKDFIHLLKPTTEQMEELRPILKRYGDQNREIMKINRETQIELFQELEEEIKPILTDDQYEKLRHFKKRWMDKRKRFNRPPPQKRLQSR